MNKSKKEIAVLIYLFITSFGMILGAFFIEAGHLLIIGMIIILTWIYLVIILSVRLIRDVIKLYIKAMRRSK